MKIFFCSNQARSTRLFWRPFLQSLLQTGHDVCLVVPEISSDTSPHDIQKLMEMASFPDSKGSLWVRTYPLVRRGTHPLQEMCSFFALKQLLQKEKPDIIFATTIKPIIYVALALRLLGKEVPAPFFACITGLGYCFEEENTAFLRRKFATKLYTFALPRAKNIFFLNTQDIHSFLQARIISAKHQDRCTLIPSTGVDTEYFALEKSYPQQPTFLLMARLLKAKGIEDFVHAATLLRSRYPSARFQLLGSCEQGGGALPLSTVQAWHKKGNIEYLGFLEDVRPAIAKASIMVLPSWREGMPCAILEGMSMGRAAVVTAVPGCKDVVEHGINGFHVPPKNPEALAHALEQFLLHPTYISTMGQRAHQSVQRFAAKTVVACLRKHMQLETSA